MTPIEIKILLMRHGKSINSIARHYSQTTGNHNLESIRKRFSMCIHREREYPELRRFIANEIGKSVEQLFGKHPRKAA